MMWCCHGFTAGLVIVMVSQLDSCVKVWTYWHAVHMCSACALKDFLKGGSFFFWKSACMQIVEVGIPGGEDMDAANTTDMKQYRTKIGEVGIIRASLSEPHTCRCVRSLYPKFWYRVSV